MAAINVNGTDYYLGRTARSRTEVTTVDCTVVGHVERRVSVGPRGGSVVRWVAHAAHVPAAVYDTRAAAVSGVVAAWVPPVESCPVDSIPVPDTCGTCLGVDGDCVCEPPVRATVTDYRAGDYVEVDIAGDVQVFTWSDDRGVRRNYSVVIDGHADYGDFMADPAGWVRRYYRDEEVDVVNVSPCPCGGSYVDGVCRSCDSCSGCAECAPKHSYAGSVSHEVLSIDVQRFGAGADPVDRPASMVARTKVRYSYPDAPDSEHLLAFSSERDGRVYVTRAGFGAGVYVDDPARFGSFSDDPVSWVHAFYA